MGEMDEFAEIAGKAAANLIEDVLSSVIESVTERVRRGKLHLSFRNGFKDYIQSILQRTGRIKTLLHPDEAILLEDIYVPLRFGSNGKGRDESEIVSRIDASRPTVIVGTAGGGKTVFLRHLNIKLLRALKPAVPIYFELREVNRTKEVDLLGAVFASISTFVPDLRYSDFKKAIEDGKIALLLDGCDEVDWDRRSDLFDQIKFLCRRNIRLILTSRPDEAVTSIEALSVFHVLPLSKDQTLILLEKLDYDDVVKRQFINRVDEELFDKHVEFLSVPLLASIMLLTFSQYSEVPEKLHIFYQQAFEVLFHRHDRSKGVFTRKTYTGLGIDVFQRAFSHFCASSYTSNLLGFGDQEIISRLRKALDYENASVLPQKLLRDLTISVCLLHREGLEWRFVHRSFQEFFAAYFISRLPAPQMKAAVLAVAKRQITDTVIPMLADIAGTNFEEAWVLPSVTELISKIESQVDSQEVGKMLNLITGNIFLNPRVIIERDVSHHLSSQFYLLLRLYPARFTDSLAALTDFLSERFYRRCLEDRIFRAEVTTAMAGEMGQFLSTIPEVLAAASNNQSSYGRVFLLDCEELSKEALDLLGLSDWLRSLLTVLSEFRADLSTRLENQKLSQMEMFSHRPYRRGRQSEENYE